MIYSIFVFEAYHNLFLFKFFISVFLIAKS